MKKHEQLKKEAKEQGFSVTDLAKLVGMHRTALSAYFNGRHTNIGANQVDKIERKLGMKMVNKKEK